MRARTYIYGKGQTFNYDTISIAPGLRPFQAELVELSGYGNTGREGHSIRYGRLRAGQPYLSFAFPLPDGSQADSRAQIRVYTFVFRQEEGCPLSQELLQALPFLTREDVEALACSGDEVDVDDLYFLKGNSPPVSQDLLLAVLATLFYREARGGRPTLLAQVSPEELLQAMAALPLFLLDEISFNTDVRSLSEPVFLCNAWTQESKQAAERSGYTGGAMDQRHFYFPAEEGVRLHVGGLESAAARFLCLSRQKQEVIYHACGKNLSALINALQNEEGVPSAPCRRTPQARRRPRFWPFGKLAQGLLILALGLALLFPLCWHIPFGGRFALGLPGETFFFLAGTGLAYGAFRLAEGWAGHSLEGYLHRIRTRGRSDDCRRLQRSCGLFLAITAGMGLLILYLVSGGSAVCQEGGRAVFTLCLGVSRWDRVLGPVLGGLLWGLSLLVRVRRACLHRLAHFPPPQKEDLLC